ncbi:MAG: cytidylate kinase family protein [Burkholderiales bacterium]|nr:cytidylate kinase family protein [Burkholderiales bacterium]
MPLIAMTREMGSFGKDVAAGVAEALAIPVLHHEIIEPLADKMRLRKSHVIRLLEGHPSFFERLTADQTSLSIYTAEETFNLAAQGRGAVLRSWGAANLLRPVSHVVCVRVCAPKPLRIERMKQRMKSSDATQAKREVEDNDEAHGAIIRRHFGVDWWDAEQYDLVLNTERMSIEECVDNVLHCVRHADFQETSRSHAMFENLRLQARVRAHLRQTPQTRTVRIAISADDGTLVLGGVVDSALERSRAAEVAAAVPGVMAVRNELAVIAERRSHHRDG